MAANNELPRGWTIASLGAAGAAVSIVVPACAGIVHVLDEFEAALLAPTAASVADITLTTSGGTYTSYVIGPMSSLAGIGNQGEASGSGLNLASAVGESMTVAFNAAIGGAFEFLRIQGHDI